MITAPVVGLATWAEPIANLCLQGVPPYSFSLLVKRPQQPAIAERYVSLTATVVGNCYVFEFATASTDDLSNGVINLGASGSKMEARICQVDGSNVTELLTDTLKVV